jgi:hypothetical protein
MNFNPRSTKLIDPDMGGNSAHQFTLPDQLLTDAAPLSELYPTDLPSVPKHSADFIQTRRKVRQIAEPKLSQLSEQLFKLAEELRYHDPLMAEMLDDARDATEEARTLLQAE